ncbi:MAG: hypothetical protein LKG12_07645 [Bifidobacterium tibiigranuli]|jgi:hypothetical protein|nr:hypothetical protein [Bifidobacterium tibiigranuli]MCI1255022.1 hypothetical protein [Bifidobacterium tibiigranuli]
MMGRLDARTLEYVRGLDAVASANEDRITYAYWFKREVVAGLRCGASPSSMFREARLGSEVIGYKRIERAVYRWRRNPKLIEASKSAKCSTPTHLPIKPAEVADKSVPMSVFLAQSARLNSIEEQLEQLRREVAGMEAHA